MHTLLLIFHVVIATILIALVMVQRGKGADAGAAFGSGASSTVFGARGSASFLTRATAVLATLFFITSLSLTLMVSQKAQTRSVTDLSMPAEKSVGPGSTPQHPADVPNVPKN
jgi:preprotein translocase subunit SecG